MSKESKPRKPRSTKSNTAELEAKIAELEAKLANLSSQVKPSEARPAQTSAPPPPKPQPRPAASGPTHGTLPAGMKPAPKPEPKPEPRTYAAPEPGEVAPAYAATSSAGYTGNKYYATRARLAYHPPNKQFKGSIVSTTSAQPPAPQPEPAPQTSRGTLPAGMKPPEKKSLWKAKGADVAEQYTPQEEHRAPPPPPKPQPRPAASGPTHGTLPAGMKPEPKPEPKPAPKPRPAASGPTHGTLPAGMKPTPKPDVVEKSEMPEVGEVAPAYATTSSAGYTGNKYYATRRRLAYHPPNKQFTGSASTTTTAPPPAPPPPKKSRGTLPAGFKP